MKHSYLLFLAAALSLALVACGGAQKTGGGSLKGQDNSPAALLARYQHLMPSETSVFVKVDMRRLTQEHLVDAFGLLQSDWDHQAMLRDLAQISVERLHMDLTQANWCVLAGSDEEAVLLCDDAVALKKPAMSEKVNDNVTLVGRVQKLEGQMSPELDKVYAFKKEKIYLLPLKKDKVAQGAAGADPASAAYLGKLLQRAGDGDLVFASNPDLIAGTMGSEAGVGISISDRVVVVFHGDKAMLEGKDLSVDSYLEEARKDIGEKLKNKQQMPTEELMAMTWAWHVLEPLTATMKPIREPEFLVYDVPTDTATHPVTVLGAVGAVIYFTFAKAFMGMAPPEPVMAPPAPQPPPPSAQPHVPLPPEP